MGQPVNSLFISDIHLGCKFTRANDLLEFLKQYKPKHVYLIGDIIDGWRIKKKGIYWEDSYSYVVRKFVGMMKKDGTKFHYAIGNHDEFLRQFLKQFSFGGIELGEEFIHETVDGRRLLILHGDKFDHITVHAPWLSHIGDNAYNFALWVNQLYNHIRRRMGLSYWSLSAVLKHKVKQAVNYISNFEALISKHTKTQNCVGVVCGHIHSPTVKELNGVVYYNCGDWVEHCTGIVEHLDGRMELVYHHRK